MGTALNPREGVVGNRPRVVLTGCGVVSPIGTGMAEFLAGLEAGIPGTGWIENFPTHAFPSALGAEVRREGAVVRTEPHVDRKCGFLETALAEALQGHEAWHRADPGHRSLHLGQGIDAFDVRGFVEADSRSDWRTHVHRAESFVQALVEKERIAGGCSLNGAACVASTQAIGFGLRKIRRDPRSIVVSGGFDSMLSPLHYLGFHRLGALSTWTGEPSQACRPFDKDRCGIVLGEGAAVLVMEAAESVAPGSVLAEVAGYASTTDAWLVTDPEPEGRMLARAALEAITDAGLRPEDIDAVHLHGTGTSKNDLAETRAMHRVFGTRYREIPVFSLKGQVGHLIGACGALELLAAVRTLQTGIVLPTLNSTTPDPEVDLRVVRGAPLHLPVRNLLKLNAAFGGQNTAIVLRRGA